MQATQPQRTGACAAHPAHPRQPSLLAWDCLARVYGEVQQHAARHLRRFGLTVAQFDVLAQVGSAEGLSQQDLAARLLVTKGNVCGLIDRLERAGLVCRQPDPLDHRINRLALTPAGRRLYTTAVPAHEAIVADAFAALAPAEQRALLALLRTLDHALSALPTGE
ncbi:MAG TPA: MarR family winged helix-turn-helix transcriptional regulator [Chloroflexota bacterium]